MLSKPSLKFVLLVIVFISFMPANCNADAAKKHNTLALLPCYDAVTTFKKFNQLAVYLKDRTGLEVDIIVPTDLEKIRSSLQNGEIDFILQDPHTYVQLEGLLNRDSILFTPAWDGTSSQVGLIIARKDNGIKTVGDLRGKRVMFGPELSITKWIAARELFKENGIDLDKDLKAYSHGECCEDIAFHVFLRAVDAGVVCDDFFDEHAENRTELGIDLKQIVVIGRTALFPTRVFAARQGIDGDILTRVNQALLDLDRQNLEHAKILGPTKIGGFRATRDQDYESIRMLMGRGPR